MARDRQFPLTYDQTVEAIRYFKQKYSDNLIAAPTIQNFIGSIDGANMEHYWDVITNPVDTNIKLAELLKNFVCWTVGEMQGRSDNSSKEYCRTDWGARTWPKETEEAKKMEITVNFGSKNKNPFK